MEAWHASNASTEPQRSTPARAPTARAAQQGTPRDEASARPAADRHGGYRYKPAEIEKEAKDVVLVKIAPLPTGNRAKPERPREEVPVATSAKVTKVEGAASHPPVKPTSRQQLRKQTREQDFSLERALMQIKKQAESSQNANPPDKVKQQQAPKSTKEAQAEKAEQELGKAKTQNGTGKLASNGRGSAPSKKAERDATAPAKPPPAKAMPEQLKQENKRPELQSKAAAKPEEKPPAKAHASIVTLPRALQQALPQQAYFDAPMKAAKTPLSKASGSAPSAKEAPDASQRGPANEPAHLDQSRTAAASGVDPSKEVSAVVEQVQSVADAGKGVKMKAAKAAELAGDFPLLVPQGPIKVTGPQLEKEPKPAKAMPKPPKTGPPGLKGEWLPRQSLETVVSRMPWVEVPFAAPAAQPVEDPALGNPGKAADEGWGKAAARLAEPGPKPGRGEDFKQCWTSDGAGTGANLSADDTSLVLSSELEGGHRAAPAAKPLQRKPGGRAGQPGRAAVQSSTAATENHGMAGQPVADSLQKEGLCDAVPNADQPFRDFKTGSAGEGKQTADPSPTSEVTAAVVSSCAAVADQGPAQQDAMSVVGTLTSAAETSPKSESVLDESDTTEDMTASAVVGSTNGADADKDVSGAVDYAKSAVTSDIHEAGYEPPEAESGSAVAVTEEPATASSADAVEPEQASHAVPADTDAPLKEMLDTFADVLAATNKSEDTPSAEQQLGGAAAHQSIEKEVAEAPAVATMASHRAADSNAVTDTHSHSKQNKHVEVDQAEAESAADVSAELVGAAEPGRPSSPHHPLVAGEDPPEQVVYSRESEARSSGRTDAAIVAPPAADAVLEASGIETTMGGAETPAEPEVASFHDADSYSPADESLAAHLKAAEDAAGAESSSSTACALQLSGSPAAPSVAESDGGSTTGEGRLIVGILCKSCAGSGDRAILRISPAQTGAAAGSLAVERKSGIGGLSGSAQELGGAATRHAQANTAVQSSSREADSRDGDTSGPVQEPGRAATTSAGDEGRALLDMDKKYNGKPAAPACQDGAAGDDSAHQPYGPHAASSSVAPI
jgi:hypothetical protein